MRRKLFFIIILLSSFANAEGYTPNHGDNNNNSPSKALPKSKTPTRIPPAIQTQDQQNTNLQTTKSVPKPTAANKEETITSDKELKKEKTSLVNKLLKLNYNTYTAPKKLYDQEPIPFNTHLPPVYFESYYLQETFEASKKNNYKKLRAILNKFDFLNGQNEDGDTILIAATQHNSIDSARILLAKGAYIDAVNNRKRTALHYAAALGNVDTTKLLLTMGANFNLKDDKGMTALEYAEFSNQPETSKIIKAYIKANQSY